MDRSPSSNTAADDPRFGGHTATRPDRDSPGRRAERDLASLAALLVGARPDLGTDDAAAQAALVRLAACHRVAPLLHERLRAGKGWDRLDPAVRARLRDHAIQEATADAYQQAANDEALGTLAEAGVEAIAFKGAALARTLYARSDLRPRDDIDLLVHPDRREAARAALEGIGYASRTTTAGSLVIHQVGLTRRGHGRPPHTVDLHWRLSNRPAIAERLDFDTLRSRAIPLGRGLAPDDADALLIACLHLDGHHRGSERLVWLYDIHLLASAPGPGTLAAFADRMRAAGLESACGRALALARHRFGTPIPPGVPDVVAALDPPQRRWRVLLDDIRALPGWAERARLLREHAFPPTAYMLARAGGTSRRRLPLLYAARLLRAVGRLFDRQP